MDGISGGEGDSAMRKYLPTLLLIVLTSLITSAAPTIANTVADFAKNAGAVDGKSAVAALASIDERKGKLVATSQTTGLLPNNIIAKAPNADLLDGVDSTGFYRTSDTVANATHAASADTATNASKLGGIDPTGFYRTTDTVAKATHATSADSATNATHATSADSATNASTLGGSPLVAWGMGATRLEGPLPSDNLYGSPQWSFTSRGGNLLISFSGSGYRSSSNKVSGRIELELYIDGVARLATWTYTNEFDSHKALPTATGVFDDIPAGDHSVRLVAVQIVGCGQSGESTEWSCTSTDGNDFFFISVLEQPANSNGNMTRPAHAKPHQAHPRSNR
jgi:hypothetical protein